MPHEAGPLNRSFWFVAGAGAGVYVMVKARRTAEMFTPEGLRDRFAGLSVGVHLFAEEMRAGTTEKEDELRERLGLAMHGPLQIEGANLADQPYATAPEHLSRTSTFETESS